MQLALEKMIKGIFVAFGQRKLPMDDLIFFSFSIEVDSQKIKNLAGQIHWTDIPNKILTENPQALAFMTPKAFAWFLPAYLVFSANHYLESVQLTMSIINFLTPPDETDALIFTELVEEMKIIDPGFEEEDLSGGLGADESLLELFEARVNELNQEEKVAVKDYLIYLQEEYSQDFPVFGPKQALERYWLNEIS